MTTDTTASDTTGSDITGSEGTVAPDAASPRASRRTVEHRALLVARLLAAAAAFLTLGQGFLAGSHLVGVDGSLVTHEQVGTEVLTVLSLLVALAALGAVRVEPWRLGVAVLSCVAVTWQIGLGFTDQLDLHIPVGISIFGLHLLLAALPGGRRRRAASRSGRA